MVNNRFRFRVWDKILKSYLKPVNFVDLERASKDKDVVIEQCTGLKDKNGRLIYEGDIVKRHSKYSEDEKDVVLQVEWNRKGARYITTDKKHDNWIFSMFDYEYEILGNIHENPELLEDKK